MTAHRKPFRTDALQTSCGRVPEDKETLLAHSGLDPFEQVTLQIFRYFFQSFSCPGSQSWMYALDLARSACGEHGAGFAHRVLDTMKIVRATRKSTFSFSSPFCAGCTEILTEHERRMMLALAAIRSGKSGVAQLELMMLCEGNDITCAMSSFVDLADAMPERDICGVIA